MIFMEPPVFESQIYYEAILYQKWNLLSVKFCPLKKFEDFCLIIGLVIALDYLALYQAYSCLLTLWAFCILDSYKLYQLYANFS